MDLRSALFGFSLLLTGSAALTPPPDIHPKFLHGVWNCPLPDGVFRLTLDASGHYTRLTIFDGITEIIETGEYGLWQFERDSLGLMQSGNYQLPHDTERRDAAIQRLQRQGEHAAAEELARTKRGWAPLAAEETAMQAVRVKDIRSNAFTLWHWVSMSSDGDHNEPEFALKCFRQSLVSRTSRPKGA